MGTNYYWYLDQELLQAAENMDPGCNFTFAINVPDIVKTVYQTAFRRQHEANTNRGDYLREDDFVVKDFSYEPGMIKVKALHIGKKSWGWAFGLHVYPDMLNTYQDWLDVFQYGTIRDEYNRVLRKCDMIKIIDVKGLDGTGIDEEKKVSRANAVQDQFSEFDPEYFLWRRKDSGYSWVSGRYKAVDYCLGHFS